MPIHPAQVDLAAASSLTQRLPRPLSVAPSAAGDACREGPSGRRDAPEQINRTPDVEHPAPGAAEP